MALFDLAPVIEYAERSLSACQRAVEERERELDKRAENALILPMLREQAHAWREKASSYQVLLDFLRGLKPEPGIHFADLRAANVTRLPQFKNAKGEPAHSQSDGSDWTVLEWLGAAAGELGEALNIAKKVRRGDMTLDEARPLLLREYADANIYLDLAAFRTQVDLGEAVRIKFNETSVKVGSDVRLGG